MTFGWHRFLLTGFGLLLVVMTCTTSAFGKTNSDQQAVINTTVAAVEARFAPTDTVPAVSEFVIVDNYALTTWVFGNGGGSAALTKNGGVWVIIAIGGGSMAKSTLVSFGVPKNIATSLAGHFSPLASPSP